LTTTLIIVAGFALAYVIIRSWAQSARKRGEAEALNKQVEELKRMTDEQGKIRAHGVTLDDDTLRRRVRKPNSSK